MERYEMKRVIQFIRGMYPGWKADSNTVDSWYELFKDHTEQEVKDAVIAFAKKKTFIPNAAEILTELLKTPDFELLEFKRPNGAMYTVKVYTKTPLLEDTAFSFNHKSKEEALKTLDYLKGHCSYGEIYDFWKDHWFGVMPVDSHIRELLRGDDQ